MSDGLPGFKFYQLGVWALCKHDYTHAMYMFRLAAYWGYGRAEYSLGLLNFRGNGVPVNRPLGTAWMKVAAQGGVTLYVKVSKLMVSLLNRDQRVQMSGYLDHLQQKYGGSGSLHRTKAHWTRVFRSSSIGSHLGHGRGRVQIAGHLSGHSLDMDRVMLKLNREILSSKIHTGRSSSRTVPVP